MEVKKLNLARIISAILICGIMIFCTGLNVHAEESKDGISVTVSSDKENYSSADEVRLKVTVKNTNNFEVINLKIENILPDGISLVSGDISKDNINLQANEETTMNLTVKKSDSGQANTTENVTSNAIATEKNTTVSKSAILPNTGDNKSVLIALIVMLVSILVMIICFLLKDRKKYSKFLSVLICLGVINALGITGVIHASSENINNFTYEYIYKIDNADYIHKIIVSYSLSENNNGNSNDNNNTSDEKKLQDGYVTDNLAQFKMEDRFDSRMDIVKTMMSNTRCEFKNAEYGEDGKGTADITVYAPNMEKILSDGVKFTTENQEIVSNYNGENLQEKLNNWINDYTIELIKSNKYEPLKTELPITIYKENNQWIVYADSKLNDALTGNLNTVFENLLKELYG